MTDKDNLLIEEFFKQAAQQQIEDNGFSKRVMMNLPESQQEKAHRLSMLWTWFCIILGVMLFFVAGGWQMLLHAFTYVLRMTLTWLEVLAVTAPTTEIPVNPLVILLALAFLGVYLPYRTYRKLSATL